MTHPVRFHNYRERCSFDEQGSLRPKRTNSALFLSQMVSSSQAVEVECRLHECMWMGVLWPCLNGRWTNWSGGRQLLNRSRNMLCSITGTWVAHPFSYLAWPLSLHCWIKWYSIAISGCVRVHWLAFACFAHVDVVLVSLINISYWRENKLKISLANYWYN